MNNNIKHISKFLSYVLRHKPDAIDLKLDENGWADLNELLSKMNSEFEGITLTDIQTVVKSNDKQRFTFNDDLTKIRANQVHSINIDLKLESTEPPELLYHGTVEKSLESIKENGIVKGSRQHVHLSKDIETATNVGNRRGEAIILKVKSKQMFLDGHNFYLSKNGVWLADFIPCQYIEFK